MADSTIQIGLVYLASAASDWVTGHTLNIDGGWIPRT